MPDVNQLEGFDWNKGNLDKSYQKHGTTPQEAEEAFLDPNLKVSDDPKHSQSEKRFVALGKTFNRKILFIVFTFRNKLVRAVSARAANQKERKRYESI
ncbi:MAG: BrnT family toxin [Candidatus Shapirobacteria bacterium]